MKGLPSFAASCDNEYNPVTGFLPPSLYRKNVAGTSTLKTDSIFSRKISLIRFIKEEARKQMTSYERIIREVRDRR